MAARRSTWWWLSTAACVLLVGAMLASSRWMLTWRAPGGFYLGVRRGWLILGHNPTLGIRVFKIQPHRDPLAWWPSAHVPEDPKTGQVLFRYYYLPLWMPAAALGLPVWLGGYRRTRGMAWGCLGRCRACGYDLAIMPELPTDPRPIAPSCPECGAPARAR